MVHRIPREMPPCASSVGSDRNQAIKAWMRANPVKRGKSIPMLALATSIGHAAVSYSYYTKGLGWRGWAMASAFTAMSIPFTMVVLMPTNRTLEAETHSRNQRMSEAEVKRLVKKWRDLNVVRCLLPLAGASWGLWSLLG